jgi:hypothetical protein
VPSDSSGEWWPSLDPTFAGWCYDDLWAELEDVNDIIGWWESERDEHPERVARYMTPDGREGNARRRSFPSLVLSR